MKELDVVALNKNFEDLNKGTLGTIVYEHGSGFFEVEFFDKSNDTIGVYTVSEKDLDLKIEWK